jgi:hypothetical protein
MSKGPKLFTCPKCRHRYLGHDPVPECPRCGHEAHVKTGFRWDMLAYLAIISALLSFFWMSSYYRDTVRVPQQNSHTTGDDREKLPGARQVPFQSPYRERGR